MEKATKFLLPSPNFDGTKKPAPTSRPYFLTPSGMTLLPREKQPPPMYGPRGTTVPSKYLASEKTTKQKFESKKNETQFCEPCEMELQSMEDFRLHRSQHQRCKIDGCNYSGHPSVMDKHVAALHTTGLFDKCKKLSTPEEIAAWREERRKRYPTVANVVMRQKAQEQRQKRGERLEANKSRFGNREDRARMKRGERAENRKEQEAQKGPEEHNRNMKNVQRNNRRKKAKRCGEASKTTAKPEIKISAVQEESETDSHCDQMFMGTKTMSDYKHFKVKKLVEAKNPLSGLIGMYGSDDESNTTDDDEEANCDKDNKDIRDKEADSATNEPGDSKAAINEESQSNDDLVTNKNTITEQTLKSSSTIDILAIEAPATETVCIYESNLCNDLNEPAKSSEIITNVITEEAVEKNESSDEAPEEAAIVKSSQLPDRAPRSEPPRKRAKPAEAQQKLRRSLQSGLYYRKSRLRKQNTMLEKLLEPDIRHERNVLLQCVRFVCENKYFGIGQQLNKDITIT